MLAAECIVSSLSLQPMPSTIRQNLTGQRFTRLKVLVYSHRNARSQTFWLCQCDCGRTPTVGSSSLLRGTTRSCGCLNSDLIKERQRQDLTGHRFGRLIVEHMEWKNRTGFAHCLCDCGIRTIVYGGNLRRANTTSCGCFHSDMLRATRRIPGAKEARKRRGSHAYLSRKRGVPYDFVRTDELFMLRYWHNSCAVCGSQADFWRVLAWDHWVPLRDPQTLGTVPENMLPLCHARKGARSVSTIPACNNSKGASEPALWLTTRLGPRQAAAKLREIEVYFASTRRRSGATLIDNITGEVS